MSAVPEHHQKVQTAVEELSAEVLREEVLKWRARVPRLVASLHEKNAELEQLREAVAQLSQAEDIPSDDGDSTPPAEDDRRIEDSAQQAESALAVLEQFRDLVTALSLQVETLQETQTQTSDERSRYEAEVASLRERNEVLQHNLELAHAELENRPRAEARDTQDNTQDDIQDNKQDNKQSPGPGDCVDARPGVHTAADDFTLINGVGNKLANQLCCGVNSLEELARIRLEDLEDTTHPLYPLRSRIISGGWIEQAAALISEHRHAYAPAASFV